MISRVLGERQPCSWNIAISEIAPGVKARAAVVGFRWDYKSELDVLEKCLAG